MASGVTIGKVLLKNSTSKMSLNDRFQLLRQQNQRVQAIMPKANVLQKQGSAKNRRLAQQMANRPAVLAALMRNNINNNRMNRRTIGNNRLNQATRVQTNVKQRLGVQRAGNLKRFQTGRLNNRGFKKNPNVTANKVLRGRIGQRPGANNLGFRKNIRRAVTKPKSVNQPIRRKIIRNNFVGGRKINLNQRDMNPNRNASKFGGKFKQRKQVNVGQAQGNKKFRINRNFQNRQQRGGFRRGFKKPMPNKDQLDKDLDAYMAGTKSQLDAELDAYISQNN